MSSYIALNILAKNKFKIIVSMCINIMSYFERKVAKSQRRKDMVD